MSSVSTKINVADILCEFFEVILHNILFTRKLYPETIFVPKKKYGVVVYQSIQPDVNEYINQSLKAVNFHSKNKRLKRLFVCIHNEDAIYEKYVFEVLDFTNFVENDPYLVDLEQSLRDFILKLHSSQHYLEELPDDITFSVRIQTTAYSSLEFNQQPAFEVMKDILTQGDMETIQGGFKRKSRLAVFEHVAERPKNPKRMKFRPNRLDADDSSQSESEELVIDDEREEPIIRTRKNPLIRITEEQLNLICEWNYCGDCFDSWRTFDAHLVRHIYEDEDLQCQWTNCGIICTSDYFLKQHVSYHGYLSKLRNIGQNILDRNDWPKCTLKESYKMSVVPEGYTCLWEYCSFNFCTIYEFISHMQIHVHNNPNITKESLNEIVMCCWQGCNTKFSTKYRLGEHVRTHTKEKVMACPTCCTVFSNKIKFCDHRKRQLATNLQSYQCSQCLKLFPSERLLRDHMRSHINHYKCTMCDMTCPKPSILAKHMRFKHLQDKPFKCQFCEQSFVTKHNLATHLKTHANEKPLKCEHCGFKCRARSGMANHNAKVHEKAKSVYQCHCCKKKFKRGGYLTKHLMRVHNYHWPSGHTRFRYRKDQDGIHRLQTVRYESLEVTQEMIKSECMQANNKTMVVNYNLKYDNVDGKANYVLSVMENGEPSIKETEQKKSTNILITINDVDEEGNIVKSEVVESGGIVKDQIVVQNVSTGTGSGSEEEKVSDNVRKRVTRSMNSKTGKGKSKSLPIVTEEDDVRYFSKDLILNYNKFEIKTPQS